MSLLPEDRARELRDLFFESAQELLQGLNEAALALEAHPQDGEILRRIRRTVHTLKGDAAACAYPELSDLAHGLEDVLRPEVLDASPAALVEVLFTAADRFEEMLACYRRGLRPPASAALQGHIRRLARKRKPEEPRKSASRAAPFPGDPAAHRPIREALGQGKTVYHIAVQLDPSNPMRSAAFQLISQALRQAGTLLALHPGDARAAADATHIEAALASKLSRKTLAKKLRIPAVVSQLAIEKVTQRNKPSRDRLDRLREAEAGASAAGEDTQDVGGHGRDASPENRPLETEAEGKKPRAGTLRAAGENSLRVETARIDTVLNLIGELIIGKSMLQRTISEFDRLHPKDPLRSRFADALAFQSRVLDDLQRSAMKIRMVSVDHLFRRFPRLVRDVAKQCGREAALELIGQDTDLDKGILDALAEPLAHLVRNAVSHGIESPQEREAAGKPRQGAVRLNAYHQGNQVVIEISDDGRGIDRQKVVRRAIERGLITAAAGEKLSEADAARLIFEPGLSTADEVTQVSGRGVGMDVVLSGLERLKGTVEVESKPAAGTRFRLMVPLTLASIQALLFRVSEKLYAVPIANVLEIARISESEIHRVDDFEVLPLRQQLLTLVRLGPSAPAGSGAGRQKTFVIVIGASERRFGLVVDGLVGEEELVIKALDDRLSASELVSGASILGDGTVVLILNITAVASRLARLPALEAIA